MFLEKGIVSLILNLDIGNLLLKSISGETKRPNFVFLECYICWWEGGEVEMVADNEMARWERWEGSKVARWKKQESDDVEKV